MKQDKIGAQLRKGVLAMLLLQAISEQSTYGYALIQRLRLQSNGLLDLREGTLYAALHRLQNDGYIEMLDTAKQAQKYYAVTEKGEQYLSDMIGFWANMVSTVNLMLTRNYEGGTDGNNYTAG